MKINSQAVVLFLKGMAMGAADIVPGVSGGTIAFITGIYEELIQSLKSIDLSAVKVLRKEGFVKAWQHINGNFLLAVFGGVVTSIFTLAALISAMMAHYPEQLRAFFFGLILVSVYYISARIKQWHFGLSFELCLGVVVAIIITNLTPVTTDPSLLVVFMAGMVAVCAMILPGISGSFILLLMGLYAAVIEAVHSFDLLFLAVMVAGCVCGLLAFSHVLSWLFKRFHDRTIAVLMGFMVGSLNKVWPWKIVQSYQFNAHGEAVPLAQYNVWPSKYALITSLDPFLELVLVAGFAGVMLVVLLQVAANWHDKKQKV